MKLSLKILKQNGACQEGINYYIKIKSPDTIENGIQTILKSKNKSKYQWSNWLLSKVLTKENKINYAIFAAEQI
jgi:hypothetical protein